MTQQSNIMTSSVKFILKTHGLSSSQMQVLHWVVSTAKCRNKAVKSFQILKIDTMPHPYGHSMGRLLSYFNLVTPYGNHSYVLTLAQVPVVVWRHQALSETLLNYNISSLFWERRYFVHVRINVNSWGQSSLQLHTPESNHICAKLFWRYMNIHLYIASRLNTEMLLHGPLTRNVKMWVAHSPGMPRTFSCYRGLAIPTYTCMKQMTWCMPG